MDAFTSSAKEMDIVSTLVIGATFGAFLAVGYAWSDFLKALSNTIIPEDDSELAHAGLYACLTSIICAFIIICVHQVHKAFLQFKSRVQRATEVASPKRTGRRKLHRPDKKQRSEKVK